MAVAVQGFSSEASAESAELKRAQSIPVRAAAVLFGFGFIWAGAGLWFVPGLDLEPSIMLAKMVLSIMMVTAGVGMTQIATDKPRFELHFDSGSPSQHRPFLFPTASRRQKEKLGSFKIK